MNRSDALTHLVLDHLAVATPDLETGSAPYRALGLVPEGEDELVSGQGVWVRAFRVGESLIELLAPAREDSPLTGFLARRGPGLHHLALRVPDLVPEMARLRGQGARFLSDTPQPGRAGSLVAFLHPKWGGGTLIELVQHGEAAGAVLHQPPEVTP